jgi:hypothetical protein
MGDPGTQMIIKGAMMAASMAMTAMQKFEGPRVDDLGVTLADYGTPLNYIWGIRRLDGRPIFWAEKIREKKVTSKTKGGKYTNYKYFGTWAVAVADHEIDAVSRIWMDKHLVYDATNEGPISVMGGTFEGLNGVVKITRGKNMRIYTGTETQEPDPRMEAWCEDRYGPDSCPAYRGVAYIVFEELPLEKFGNRIPQITVEAINNSVDDYPTAEITGVGGVLTSMRFSPGYSRFWINGIWYDTATRTPLVSGTRNPDCVLPSGQYYTKSGISGELYLSSPDGSQSILLGADSSDGLSAGGRQVGNLTCFYGFSNNKFFYLNQESPLEIIGVTFDGPGVNEYFEDIDGNPMAVGATGTSIYFYNLPSGAYQTVTSPVSSGTVYAFDNGEGSYFVHHGTKLLLVNKGTMTVTSSMDAPHNSDLTKFYENAQPGVNPFWLHKSEIDTVNFEIVQTVDTTPFGTFNAQLIYEPVSHAFIHLNTSANVLTWLFLDRPGSDGVDLGDVVEEVSTRCGLDSVDVSDLTQTVQGYSVTQGSGKDWISPLLEIHDVEARPHDFIPEFINRGGAIQGSILTEEYVREGDEPRYTVTIAQDTDLPRKVSLTFADQDKDQQPNTVISQRPLDAADTVREQTIDLSTYVATPGDAQKFADRVFRRKWNERETSALALSAQYLGMEPGDAYNIDLDGVTRYARVKKVTLSQGRLNVEFVRDAISFATLGTGTGAPMEGRDDEELFIPGVARGFVLDIPLVADAHSVSNPLLYYAAGAYGGDFPGAIVYEADPDLNEFSPWNSVEAADKAVWGYTTDTLGDVASARRWDRGNTINVRAFGTLTSCTEADIESDPSTNMAVVGVPGRYEIVNFTTATLEGDGTYTVSGFKRGRRGTEWACSGHETGDEFILVSSLESDGLGLSDVGSDITYRVETIGRDVTAAPDIDLEPFTGATLKPYAPARLKRVFDGTDLDCEIIRQTRLGGEWSDSGSVSLSENSEEYEVDVYSGATFKRTITVSGTNLFTYTAAMAATDGITLPSGPTFEAYQMSDAVGRGFALAA